MKESEAREMLSREYEADGHPHRFRVLKWPLASLPYTDRISIRLLMLIPKADVTLPERRSPRDDLAYRILVGVWGEDLADVYFRNGDMRRGEAFKAADAALEWMAEGVKQ